MLITEQKPMEEILQYLDGEKDIFLVGCKGCSEGCETGGEHQVAEMKQRLEEVGKAVTGTCLIDFACNDQLTRITLRAHESKIVASDSLLMLCCGIGVQAAASVVDMVVHPGCNTISLDGRHGEWREGERCLESSAFSSSPAASVPSPDVPRTYYTVPVAAQKGGNVKSTPTCPAPGI